MLSPLANKRRHTNFLWRLDIYRKELTLAFQGRVALRTGRGFLATESEDTGGESITASVRPLARMHKISWILTKKCIVRGRIESYILFTSVQEKTLKFCDCVGKIDDNSCRR